MSLWSRTLVYLGLREEPEDAMGAYGMMEDVPQHEEAPRAVAGVPQAMPAPRPAEPSNVRPLRTSLDLAGERVTVVHVRVFDDVEVIGSRYRSRQPVLFDVSSCSREVARRSVDFVSGLTFVSRGSLRRTAPRAFLLVPEGVDIPLDERRRLAQLGYDVEGVAR